MHCRFIAPGVIVCGGRRSFPRCSTPGCRRGGDRLCDHPVKRENPPTRGDARLHREHKVIFYVWSVDGDVLNISQQSPNEVLRPNKLQSVTVSAWFSKSDATCDRPVCSGCAVNRGGLDLCGAHARETTKELPAAAGEERTP